MVPFYLLELEANMYPVYVDNSNIDESLTHDFKISEIIIKISDTIWESYSKQDDSCLVPGRYSESQAQHLASGQKRNNARAMTALAPPKAKGGLLVSQDEERKGLPQSPMPQPSGVSRGNISREAVCEPLRLTDVSLLTTADKVIKRCEKDLETRLKGRRDHLPASKMQILKFKSVDSYAYGEQQLIYFVEIREYLRARAKDNKKPLELVLISLGSEENNAGGVQARQTHHSHAQAENMQLQFPPLIDLKQLPVPSNDPA